MPDPEAMIWLASSEEAGRRGLLAAHEREIVEDRYCTRGEAGVLGRVHPAHHEAVRRAKEAMKEKVER